MKIYSAKEIEANGYVRCERGVWIKELMVKDSVYLMCPQCGCITIEKQIPKQRPVVYKIEVICPVCCKDRNNQEYSRWKTLYNIPKRRVIVEKVTK